MNRLIKIKLICTTNQGNKSFYPVTVREGYTKNERNEDVVTLLSMLNADDFLALQVEAAVSSDKKPEEERNLRVASRFEEEFRNHLAWARSYRRELQKEGFTEKERRCLEARMISNYCEADSLWDFMHGEKKDLYTEDDSWQELP